MTAGQPSIGVENSKQRTTMPKIFLSFKTPDAVNEAIVEAAAQHYTTDEDKDEFIDKASSLAERWIEYGEAVCLELDTDCETIKVCEVE